MHVYRYTSMIFLINMQLFQIKVNVENSRRNKIFLQNVVFQSYKVKEKKQQQNLNMYYSFIYEFIYRHNAIVICLIYFLNKTFVYLPLFCGKVPEI